MNSIDAADGRPARSKSLLWMVAALAVLVAVAAGLILSGRSGPNASKAAKSANEKAVAALQAVPPAATLEQTLASLNQIVVAFAPDSATVPPESEAALRLAAMKVAALPPNVKIDVVAITQAARPGEADFKLALERAASVVAYMQQHGAPDGRLRPLGSTAAPPAKDKAGAAEVRTLLFRAAS